MDSCYYNAGEICKFKEVPYRVVHSAGSVNANYSLGITDIMGYTCLEQDCLYHDFKEPVSVSDILLFGNVGGAIQSYQNHRLSNRIAKCCVIRKMARLR